VALDARRERLLEEINES